MSDVEREPTSESLKELLRRASAAGIGTQYLPAEDEEDAPERVRLDFENGRAKRALFARTKTANELLKYDFESVVFLSRYQAIAVRSSGAIEALLSTSGGMFSAAEGIARLLKQPNVRTQSLVMQGGEADGESEEQFTRFSPLPERWGVQLDSGDGITLELGPAGRLSSTLMAGGFPARQIALRITGVDITRHDEAVEALERYGNAFLFELDVVHGIALRLGVRRSMTRLVSRDPIDRALTFPKNRYAEQSLALYQYGRSAVALPLLEYLAYYQSVEHFFPYFAREQVMQSLRATLLHPRFDPSNDAELARVLDLSANGGRTAVSEREQLRATIRACVNESELIGFLNSVPNLRAGLFEPGVIRGVSPLREGKNADDLRDQVADRVYTIRCRIVHSKSDGGPSNVDVLLPRSEEADALTSDIDLIRYLSQQTLIGRAARS